MDETELRRLLKDHGWSLSLKRARGHYYCHAVKRIRGSLTGGRVEIYLGPLAKLPDKTEADIVGLLPVMKQE